MAQELDDGEFWLPSEFLTENDLLTDFKKKESGNFSRGFFGNSFGFHSDLSSPIGSVTGSTETESDEDDFINFLTRIMTHSTLHDSYVSSVYPAKGWKMSGSPQSILCGCKPVSSPGSPKTVSQVSSPPQCSKDAVGWDLFCAAAEKVAMMRVNEASATCYQPKMAYPPLKPSPVAVPGSNRCPASGFYPNHKTQAQISHQKMQAIQMLKSEKWGQAQRGNQFQNARKIAGVEEMPSLLPPQRQPQQMPSSGMRAVFLAENGAKKVRTGTGVFLPRGYGTNTPETSRPGSAVLLPDRVVHTLNLNLGSIHASAQAKSRGETNSSPDFGLTRRNNNIMMAQQRRNLIPQPVLNQEFCLPQEWTY